MKAICIARETELEVRDIAEPTRAADGHLLVRMEASAINPGDKYFLQNVAARAAFGTGKSDVWGASGAGRVIGVGSGVPAGYEGKRVALYRSLVRTTDTVGLWCEVAQMPYLTAVILPDEAEALDYSGSLVNVITAYAFLEQIKLDGHKGVVATAGGSATGRALLKLAQIKNIPALGIVRSQAQRQALADHGLTNILLSTDADFTSSFAALAQALSTTAVFEGVGGDLVTQITPHLPRQSTLYFYGFLAGPVDFSIQSRLMLEKNLTLRGFSNFMTRTVQDHGALAEALKDLSSLIADPIFKTTLGDRFSFDQIDAAIKYQGAAGVKALLIS
jgi:NADPH2:quinone reductase